MITTKEDCVNRPMNVFLHYIVERERIRFHKENGGLAPHTKDPILAEWKFCNIHRQHDAVTKHYLRWIDPLVKGVHPSAYTDAELTQLVGNTQMYRTINWPPTLDAIGHISKSPNRETAKRAENIERGLHAQGQKTFTGAYLISQCGRLGDPKIRVVMDSVLEVYDRNVLWVPELRKNSIQATWTWFRRHVSINGPFTAYEIVTDLTYHVLSNADDLMTWANAGPGALRGINRLLGRDKKTNLKPADACAELRKIMELMASVYTEQARRSKAKSPERIFWQESCSLVNMRTAEHTMCEYDKYCRVATGDGFPRSKYHPGVKGAF